MATINGTDLANILDGTALDDIINGLGGNDTLNGLDGNDTLDGGTGADTMLGGSGNDTYIVDNTSDRVFETTTTTSGIDAGGIDAVLSSVSYSIANTIAGRAFIENLTLTGTANLTATGNDLDNILTGNSGANKLVGGAGIDTLYGGAGIDRLDGGLGADIMFGNAGNDTYIVNDAADQVFETATQSGTTDEGGVDTVVSSVSYSIASSINGRQFIENLTLSGAGAINATGNDIANKLSGNTGANILTGGLGNDTLSGGGGNDQLDGGRGNDKMLGGAGDDTYFVDSLNDQTFETTTTTGTVNAGGTDTVMSSVSYSIDDAINGRQFIENLTLTGAASINATGNSLANVLTGNSGANILDGGLGIDTLIGGLGNDTYIITAGDTITEDVSGGTDTVNAGFTYTLGANIENLLLTGTSPIDGTGNELANTISGNSAINVLHGGLGNDILNGLGGADSLFGDGGNDTYIIDNAGVTVTESLNDGTDLVQASVTHTLSANVENLTLTGSGIIDGTGNSLANVITGNAGANTLHGLDGNDTLSGGDGVDTLVGGLGMDRATGGLGNDVFKFASALDSWAWDDFASSSRTGCDSIADFTTGDKIDLKDVDAISSPSGHNVYGDQAFTWIGTSSFVKHKGQQLRYETYNGDTYIYGNINGDTVADFCIKLDGLHTLSGSDFIL